MTDYKTIHGKNILHVASDLDTAEGEGQIWFNTTSSDYKTITKVAGAWSTGGSMNTARDYCAGAGTKDALLIAGGHTPATELYNGSSWTEIADMSASAAIEHARMPVGISTAALMAEVLGLK
mgnify:CR=1 FL=1